MTSTSAGWKAPSSASPSWIDRLLERDLLPDSVLRRGIRRLLRTRLRDEGRRTEEERECFIDQMKSGPIAIKTRDANDQHYELPTRFFQLVLGSHLKYSSGDWSAAKSLDEAESAMLARTCDRARLADGMRILELGCGWGSLSLWMAAHYPAATITAVSNSVTQKAFIDGEAARCGLANLEVITADMCDFEPGAQFDRVVSVEMFEHMRNWEELLRRIAGWLRPEGLLFVHIFTHRERTYFFDGQGAGDWMSRYFFSGGVMPSEDLFHRFGRDLEVAGQWRVNGTHYGRTAEAWLENMDAHRGEVRELFAATYGPAAVSRWWVYWRLFFMSCVELWGYDRGREWFVSHYLLKRTAGSSLTAERL